MTRLAYLVSHPIQYQAPLLQRIAGDPDIDLHVLFMSDFSLRTYEDLGFGREVKWDVPLVDGYSHEFLPLRGEQPNGSESGFRNHGLGKIIRKERFDVLWSHGYALPTNIKAMLIARSRGIPVLCRSDNQRKGVIRGRSARIKEQIVRRVMQIPSGFLTTGAANDAYYAELGVPEERRFLMPYAIDNDRFRTQALAARGTREDLRAELGLDPGRPIILYASKFITRKKPIDALRALQEIVRAGRIRRPYLVYVGDGEERANVEAAVTDAERNDVRFVGFQNQTELPRYFDLCDVFVLPAAAEPYGLVVNEVMCAGRAVIVTDEVGAGIDLVKDGENGFIYPVGDIPAFVAALEKVLESPERSIPMGERSWEIVREWDFDSNIRALKQAISSVRGGSF